MFIFFLIIIIFILSNISSVFAKDSKIYCIATIDDDFDDSSIIVVMKDSVGEINRTYEENYFGNIEKVYIADLTHIEGNINDKKYLNYEGFSQILEIKLPINDKQNVLNCIKELEKIDGIMYAGPNYITKLAQVLNDPSFSNSHFIEEYGTQWGLVGEYGIDASETWNITIDDFKDLGLEIVAVEWLTKVDRYAENNSWPDYWHQIYSIIIANKGKQNVIAAIKIMAELNFVQSAGPNGIMYAQGSWRYKYPN